MPLTILHVAYPLAPVSRDAVGGAEQVLALLDEGLVERGHRSIVVATLGSSCRGELVATPAPRAGLDLAAKTRARRDHRIAIARALDRYSVDLVHMHGVDFERYLPAPGVPVLATLHLMPSCYSPGVFSIARASTFLNCVSAAQRAACPPGAALCDDVPNGVPIDRLRFSSRKREVALALGRICPEKGFDLALRAAAQAGMPALLAGQVFGYEEHVRHYDDAIAPLLDGHARRFLGPLDFARKRRLLAAARCLLVPSLVPETSSLVAMEALASGTPVIAFRRGALPEIVDHGETGYVVDDVDGMADAIGRVSAIDPRACRRAAEERFSAARMIDGYLDTYRRVLRAHRCAGLLAPVVEEIPCRAS